MAVYAGRHGVVYLSTSGTGTATPVVHLTEWSINRTQDKIDVTGFGDANKTYVQGLPDVKGTFKGFYDDTESKILGAAASSDGCKIYLYPSSDAPTKFWSGPAWLDASMTVGVNGAVSIDGSFAANGSWANTF